MANNISSETLFNFTTKYEYLQNTLIYGFSPRYCMEEITPFFDRPVHIAMKCFCDIPLSLIHNHSNLYGRYAIGIKKSWGIANGLNPVFYYNPQSFNIESLMSCYKSICNAVYNNKCIEVLRSVDCNYPNMINHIRESFTNYKPIEGRMLRDGKFINNIYFYNEREWRLTIPKDNEYLQNDGKPNRIPTYIRDKQGVNNTTIEEMNKLIFNHCRVKFDYKDINFIIVDSKEDVKNLCILLNKQIIDESLRDLVKTKILIYSDIDKNV